MPTAPRLLFASEARRRRGTMALVLTVFLLATAGLSILVGSVAGVERAVGRELRHAVGGDGRFGMDDPRILGPAPLILASDEAAGRIEARVEGARAQPRLEFEALLLRGERYEDFTSGLAVGLDVDEAPHVRALLTAGAFPGGESVWVDGAPRTPIVVGEPMLEALGAKVAGATPGNESLVDLTAGRFEDDGVSRPIVRSCVIVGTYLTGFEPLDRRVVYMDLQSARELLRLQFADAPATVIVVHGGDPAALSEVARDESLAFADADAFAQDYLRAVFEPLHVFTALVVAVVLALAGGWVAQAVAAAVVADARRLSILRALGLPTRLLVGPLAALLLLLAAGGTLGGLVLARLVAAAMAALRVRAPGYDSLDVVATPGLPLSLALAAAVLLTAALAALAAGVALRRIPVADALRRA